MNSIKRPFVQTLSQRFQEKKPLIQIVMGPRQVGKTTGILQYLETYPEQYHYASADDLLTSHQNWIMEQWQAALLKGHQTLLVIDEVQKIPQWSETIKKLWDEQRLKKTQLKLLLSGSSSLSLAQGTTESLAGRFEAIFVYHWDYIESKSLLDLDLKAYLRYGGYPKSYDFIQDKTRWQSYLKNSVIDRVIDKDILQHAHVKKPALFRQAFELACCYPAQEISYRKLLGQLQDKGNVDLIKYYLSLFENAFLIKTLQKYQKQDFKIKNSSPKILLLAPCFYHLFSPKDEKYSFLFESSVGAKLLQITSDIYYWRESYYEVDFIMPWQNNLIAIEVKSGRKRKRNGLDKFLSHFPEAIPIIISANNYENFIQSPINFLERLIS